MQSTSFVSFFIISRLISITVFKASNSRFSIAIQMYCCSFVIIPWFYTHERPNVLRRISGSIPLTKRWDAPRPILERNIENLSDSAEFANFFLNPQITDITSNYVKNRKIKRCGRQITADKFYFLFFYHKLSILK